jgi:cyclopropane fatty-acyl-phospholipid synthase-like methyltransferase
VTPDREAWEDEYGKKGILWSGLTHELPELPAGSRVLELGCGNGKTLPALIKKGWNVTALDSSEKAVTLSRNLVTGSSLADIIVADARHIPVKNATFDAIFAIHVIGHMHEQGRREIAFEVTRTLKPGGILFFCEFSTDDVRFGKGHRTEASTFMRGTKISTHYFTLQEASDLFLGLMCKTITLHQWPMRIRGNNLVRSEVIAVFSK